MRTLLAYFCVLWGLVSSGPAHSTSSVLTDVQARLVIIHHFVGQYTSWPGTYALEHNSEINLCSAGDGEVAQQLTLMEQASTQELRVKVLQHIRPSQLERCHVLYIARSEQSRLRMWLRRASAYPVLTISSINGFVAAGGMVGLETQTKYQGNFEKEFVRYSVNLSAIQRVHLGIHPDAMELAWRVQK